MKTSASASIPTPSSSPAATPGLTLSCSLTRRPAICSSSGTSPTLSLPYEPDSHHHGVSAALEYAVRHLHIGHIMVMGHAKCGGFTSLLEASHSDDEFLNIWMNLACRAKAEVDSSLPGADPDERQRACEMWGVRFSLDNLMGYPWIKSAVDGGELLLHGLYFDMGSGELLYFDAESETYVPMVNACASGTSSVKKR